MGLRIWRAGWRGCVRVVRFIFSIVVTLYTITVFIKTMVALDPVGIISIALLTLVYLFSLFLIGLTCYRVGSGGSVL